MGYDLHVVRTKDWLGASLAPITRHEVDTLVATDPELESSLSDYIDMRDETEGLVRYPLIIWNGVPCFLWHRDQITCSNPTLAQRMKLARIARSLNAYLVGDDGEMYALRKNIFGQEKLVIVDPDR